jgi:hypothetical protein
MDGACSMFGERRGNVRVLLVKHEGKARHCSEDVS